MNSVMSEKDISRALIRISHEILERNSGSDNLVLLGIPTRGAHLAFRISEIMAGIEGHEIPTGTLDVTLYRDDLRIKPPKLLLPTKIPTCGTQGRDVVLIDDVLFSGRTIASALDALGEIGRPKSVQLAVLVDRGHRELPIKADYVGKNFPTGRLQSVRVFVAQVDGRDEVVIEQSVDS